MTHSTGEQQGWRVLVVDDHPVVRRGLHALLMTAPWVAEVVEAGSVAAAVAAATVGDVDLVLMDVGLPDGDGIDATRRILRARPTAAVLMLTIEDDPAVIDRALRAGARGYLGKDAHPDAVLDALRIVRHGGVVLDPRAVTMLLDGRGRAPAPPFDRLTERERTILAGLTAGDTNALIARRLGLSEKTVRNQVGALFAKLGVRDRVQAVLLAKEAGLDGLRPDAGPSRGC
jgi:two-component system nitrate/nitrite response regulator NarL